MRSSGRPDRRTEDSVRPEPLTPTAAAEWRRRWDRQQEAGVSDRETRFDAIMEALAARGMARFRFLDLGAGTGSLSERILRRFPAARGVALDFDPVLLAIGRAGLGDYGGRLQWVEADLRTSTWPDRLPRGLFDAVVSSTALHWFTGRQLQDLYVVVARQLRRDGWLVNADDMSYEPTSPTLRQLARRSRPGAVPASNARGESWDAWWSAVGADASLAREVAVRRLRYPHSHMGTATPDLRGHVRRLRRAGFREVEIVWSRWTNRVLVAVR